MNYPILTLEIENMRQSVKTAFGGYLDEFRLAIEKELERICTDSYINAFLHEEVEKLLNQTMNEEIRSYFEYGEGRRKIRKVVESKMNAFCDETLK